MAQPNPPGAQSRRSLLSIVAGLIILVANGCSAAGNRFQGEIAAHPSSVLRLSWVKAKRTNQGVAVWGQIQQVRCCGFVRGHIHLEAKDSSGGKLAAADVPWGDFNPRQFHSAWFKADLPVPVGSRATAIDIQFSTESRE